MSTESHQGMALQPERAQRRLPRMPGRSMITGFLLTCLGMNALAAETRPLAARLAALQVPDVSWQEQQSVDMSGIPIHVRPFSSTLDATQLARALASGTERFQRLTTLADTLLLSGLHADAHWLAKIDVSATGSMGYVSVLESGAAMPVPDESQRDLRAWLPHDAAPLYRHRSISTGRVIEQHIYSVSGSTATSMAYVRQQLRRQGWKNDPSFAGVGGASAWRRKGAELTILASAQPQGSALYLQHLE